jgi:hypothetical protein
MTAHPQKTMSIAVMKNQYRTKLGSLMPDD